MKQYTYEVSLKKIGMVAVDSNSLAAVNSERYKEYIKILYLPKDCSVRVDFSTYFTEFNSLFFISPNQMLSIENVGNDQGYLIYYNRDFYCIQIHDDEVACDGLLFNNIHNIPMTPVPSEESMFIDYLFNEVEKEFGVKDPLQEEMIRTYLKQLLIRATRLWKTEHLGRTTSQKHGEIEVFRQFTQLVEAYYKQKHSVAAYADILAIAPKTLTHKLKKMDLPSPNDIIKNRIILEAKRLLVHTQKTAKEVAYDLGYEDPAYFSRLFTIKTGETPSGYRNKYLNLHPQIR
ncbi:helix-turn-helix domain-containing protein [uncultured Chryseobacterium sp.]|jgi:AraC-type DNA-binding domain-containing proteins|uniref:helix-turn-helix domain-containing protein n=1 Tax=uncultured Chryseobacterium sp. TaxID=259322 RepID=UPI002632A287|nr:helix-turn-helix domain-containing protein [uncultured Chryseobacterium sp.]